MSEADGQPSSTDERRQDYGVRAQIQILLELIREFYAMCHMVAVGQLEPSKAKAKARDVEHRLNGMMAEMLQRIDEMDREEGEGEDD